MHQRRPRLAYPFTVLAQPNTVRLVAGEDYRYTLTGAGLERWLPDLLGRCNGGATVASLLDDLAQDQRRDARHVLERLYGERVLVDGPAAAAHAGRRYCWRVSGSGALVERLTRSSNQAVDRDPITIYCQDRLDYAAALATGAAARARREPFLWVSYGPCQRAYISPLFLPDAGPCFACLYRCFQRLSPAPEIYAALLELESAGRSIAPSDFAGEGIDILDALVRWKLAQAEAEQPTAVLYRLHVLERATLEISTHRVFVDPECPGCCGGRP